ncbi:MAG: oligosaccharide flippase family protein [Desulfovibrionaceae bacterium]|nr:oligosaccharide flippase family protein [Desulfovibrionaceae bacterium]
MDVYTHGRIKSALIHFFSGKVIAAVGGVVFQILIARAMAPADYGKYVVLFGLIHIIGMFSSFGLQYSSQRFLPESILKSSKRHVFNLVVAFILIRLCLVIIFGYLLLVFHNKIFNFIGINIELDILEIWIPSLCAVVIYIFLSLLAEIFLLQRITKWASFLLVVLRLLSVCYAFYVTGDIDLLDLARVELLSFSVSTVFLGVVLIRYVLSLQESGSEKKVSLRRILNMSKYAYLRELVYIFSSNASNRLIAAKYLSMYSLASYGFAAQLSESFQRYLPAKMLKNMFTPLLLAKFSENRSTSTLNAHSFLIFKTNLFVLTPILLVVLICGPELCGLLSDGKYVDSYLAIALLVISFIINGHNEVLQLLTSATELNKLLFYSAVVNGLFLFPVLILTYYYGLYGMLIGRIVGMIFGECYLAFMLIQNGVFYMFDSRGFFKILFNAFATYIFINWIKIDYDIFGLLVIVPSIFLSFYIISFFNKPYTSSEREAINRIIPRNLFIW